jgi:Fe-S-cluster containining protein
MSSHIKKTLPDKSKSRNLDCEICGNCCKQEGDYIPLTVFDFIRLSKTYDIKEFMKNTVNLRLLFLGCLGEVNLDTKKRYSYSILINGWIPLSCMYLPCTFQKNNKCIVQKNKPLICISFPYHLPKWDKDSYCGLIKKLSNVGVNKVNIPINSDYALKLYQITLSATMYQFNLPVYKLENNKLSLFKGFRDIINKNNNSKVKYANQRQISSWIKRHFTEFIYELDLERSLMDFKTTIYRNIYDENFIYSYFEIVKKMSRYHFVSEKNTIKMVNHFLQQEI